MTQLRALFFVTRSPNYRLCPGHTHAELLSRGIISFAKNAFPLNAKPRKDSVSAESRNIITIHRQARTVVLCATHQLRCAALSVTFAAWAQRFCAVNAVAAEVRDLYMRRAFAFVILSETSSHLRASLRKDRKQRRLQVQHQIQFDAAAGFSKGVFRGVSRLRWPPLPSWNSKMAPSSSTSVRPLDALRLGAPLRLEQGFPTSLLPGRSSNALRCARWMAHIAILCALPVSVLVLMVFLPRAPHRCSPKFLSTPLQIAMAATRLVYLPRLLKVASSALLILLDANRSWREVLRHDCLSMWLQAIFINQVLPHTDGPMLLSWCDFAATSTRRWKHMVKAWVRSHVPQRAWNEELHWPCYECGFAFCLASCSDGSLHGGACRGQFRFTVRFLDVCCLCCLTLFHTRQRVHEHLVDGKRRCLQAFSASVEPASDEWQPKHLPAIRMHGPVQPWAHRSGRWSSA